MELGELLGALGGGVVGEFHPAAAEHGDQDAGVRAEAARRQIFDVAGLRMVLADHRAEQTAVAVLRAAPPLGHEVFIGDGEPLGQCVLQAHVAGGLVAAVAADAVVVEDLLHVGGIVQHAARDGLAGLRPGHGGRAREGAGRGVAMAARGVLRRFVAADAAARFAGHVVDVGALGLHGHAARIERLQEDVAAGGHDEVRGAIFFHRHDAVLHLQAQVRVLGDARVLLVVFVARPVAARGPRPRHLLQHAQPFDRAALDLLEAVIDVADHADGLAGLGARGVARRGQQRRHHARPERVGQPAGDRGVAIDRPRRAVLIEQVETVSFRRVPLLAPRLVRHEEAFHGERVGVLEEAAETGRILLPFAVTLAESEARLGADVHIVGDIGHRLARADRLGHVEPDHRAHAVLRAVRRAQRHELVRRAGDGPSVDQRRRQRDVVAVDLLRRRAVGPHRPEAFYADRALVHVFPARVEQPAVGQHRGRGLADRAVAELLEVLAVAIHPVEDGCGEIVGAVAEDAELAARGDEGDAAIGQVARLHVVGAMVVVREDAVVADQIGLVRRWEGQLAQVLAVHADLEEAVALLRGALPSENDFFRVERDIEPLEHAVGQLRQQVAHLAALQVEDAEVAARQPRAVDVLGVIVVRGVGETLDEHELLDPGCTQLRHGRRIRRLGARGNQQHAAEKNRSSHHHGRPFSLVRKKKGLPFPIRGKTASPIWIRGPRKWGRVRSRSVKNGLRRPSARRPAQPSTSPTFRSGFAVTSA